MENVSDETVLGFVVSNIFGNFHRDPYLGTFIDEYSMAVSGSPKRW